MVPGKKGSKKKPKKKNLKESINKARDKLLHPKSKRDASGSDYF